MGHGFIYSSEWNSVEGSCIRILEYNDYDVSMNYLLAIRVFTKWTASIRLPSNNIRRGPKTKTLHLIKRIKFALKKHVPMEIECVA